MTGQRSNQLSYDPFIRVILSQTYTYFHLFFTIKILLIKPYFASNPTPEVGFEAILSVIAFPAISTGVYGFPKESVAEIVRDTVIEYLRGPHTLDEIRFILFSQDDYDLYSDVFSEGNE